MWAIFGEGQVIVHLGCNYKTFGGGFKNGVASWRFAGIDTHLDSIFADSDACFGA